MINIIKQLNRFVSRRVQRNGSIMIVTLLFLAIIGMISQQLLRTVIVQRAYDDVQVGRIQATQLALAGLQVAIAALTQHELNETAEQVKQAPGATEKLFLQNILPHLNRYRTFTLTQAQDGIDGTLNVCIAAESGKININSAFDFKNKTFREPWYKILAGLSLRIDGKKLAPGEFLKRVTEFLAVRGKPLDDISQLLAIKDFDKLKLDYEPPALPARGQEGPAVADPALRDLFTVWNTDDKIEPWLLSSTMASLLGLRQPQALDVKTMKEQFSKAIEGFAPDLGKDWERNWPILQNFYEDSPKDLPKIKQIFTQEFAPSIYTVLSWGKIHTAEKKILAVLVKDSITVQTPDKQEKKRVWYTIQQIYWL